LSIPERDYVVELIAKRIAGDIVMSESPGDALRKWREYFEVSQLQLAKVMGVRSSVISDYEKNRRSPGYRYIRKLVLALIKIDMSRGSPKLRDLAKLIGIPPGVVLDMRDFEKPASAEDLISVVDGILLTPRLPLGRKVYGYTIIDSIRAIATLKGTEFYFLLGGTPERAVIFTGVRAGRSPLVAVRVSPVKPSVIILHGPRRHVDPLAIRLAEIEGIPLILSAVPDVESLVRRLRAATVLSAGPVGPV